MSTRYEYFREVSTSVFYTQTAIILIRELCQVFPMYICRSRNLYSSILFLLLDLANNIAVPPTKINWSISLLFYDLISAIRDSICVRIILSMIFEPSAPA